MREIIIIGAGGQGSEDFSYIKDLIASGEDIVCAGFVDENRNSEFKEGVKIFGDFNALDEFLHLRKETLFYYITATGDNHLRQRFVQKVESLSAKNISPFTLRHPRALIGEDNEVGLGTLLAPQSIITTHSKIGRHCILNVNASVSHDCVIGDFVNINPQAVVCGNVIIGQGCYIGAGAVIIDKVSIGDWTIIGAGAVVAENMPAAVTAVGVPARVIKNH